MTGVDPVGPYAALESRLGHRFSDRTLCEAALTHRSWVNEKPQPGRTDNERLEFLGDAVLSLAVSAALMKRFPQHSEGELSKSRAAIVSEAGLFRAAEELGLGQWIFIGRGEELAGGRRRPSIVSNALEALLGAVFLDGGFAAATAVVERLVATMLDDAGEVVRLDFKSRLQERAQALLQTTPQYAVVAERGPEHAKTFEVVIQLDGSEQGRATGRSKKEAEQNAAAMALEALNATHRARGRKAKK